MFSFSLALFLFLLLNVPRLNIQNSATLILKLGKTMVNIVNLTPFLQGFGKYNPFVSEFPVACLV